MPDYGPYDTSYDTARERAAQRRAEEDRHTDEYGIEKPAKSWMSRLSDYVYPQEVANATDKPWYADLAAFGAIPATLYGSVMDEISPWDTRGDLRPTAPILGPMGEGGEQAEYQKKRAEAEERACGEGGGDWDPDRDQCNPSSGGEAAPAPEAAPAEEPNYTPAEPAQSEIEQ